MTYKWKEMKFTNHGGTAWVRLDEAEKALKEQGDKAYEMWYTTVQERAEKAEEGYNRVVCENQRLIQDWRQAEKELLELEISNENLHKYIDGTKETLAELRDENKRLKTQGVKMNTQTCVTCPWWYKSPNSRDHIGQCRIAPPKFLNNSDTSVGYWPSIDGNIGWCREHPAQKGWYK